jgi:hypothetical protein
MDDEVDSNTFRNPDLEQATLLIGSDQHHEITEVEYPDWVPVRVQGVLVSDPMFAGAVQNRGIHGVKLS